MIAFLKLTRPLNLAIMVLTMVAMRYGVVGAYLSLYSADLQARANGNGDVFSYIPNNTFHHAFGDVLFWALVISTVLIAAGGNVINDYFDTRIDRVNKPDAVIVGRSVKRRVAMAGHLVLSGIGLVIGVFVAWKAGQWKLALIPVFAVGSLWYYSTTMKRSFIIGNGVVALLSALVPLIVGLYEIPALNHAYPASLVTGEDGAQWQAEFDFLPPMICIAVYAGFAFITTLLRELQKDMADVRGDQAEGCRTVPIVLGMRWAKALALTYIGLTCAAILFLVVAVPSLRGRIAFLYVTMGIIGPLLLSAGFTFNALGRKEYITAANLMKVAMLIAILFAFLLSHTLWSPERLLAP